MGCGHISAESNSTALDVGTRDVNLHSGHIGGRRDDLADPDVVLGGVTGDVCDDGQVRKVLSQPRQLLGHDDVEARILQADGVEHASWSFSHPNNRIATARLKGGRLDHDRPKHRQVVVLCVLGTKTETPAGGHDRVLKVQAWKGHGQSSHSRTSSAASTGPSKHTRNW